LRQHGERQLAARALTNLGAALHKAGRVVKASTAFGEYLAICQQTGDQESEASARASLDRAIAARPA
jgi:hypothetical protein